ncbi:MAG: cysteine hydrolase [Candidatus Aenigmarchaeota archaeon]|nr:cysteine hydrolase [Candidatus Aenigmarchaeota archaeon]
MNKVAVIVDTVNEWFNPKSPYFLGENKKYRSKMKELADSLRKNKIPIVFIQHIEPDGEVGFQRGTDRIEIIPELGRKKDEPIITKVRSISPFYKTSLEETLKKLRADHLIVAGIMTNLCVRSCVADAWDREYKITVVADCCLSDSEKTDKAVFEDIKNTRSDVELVPLKSLKL